MPNDMNLLRVAWGASDAIHSTAPEFPLERGEEHPCRAGSRLELARGLLGRGALQRFSRNVVSIESTTCMALTTSTFL
jgi:hypothetical protein